jgi:hypothetical protein
VLIEFNSLAHQPIEHRRFCKTIVPTDIAPPEIVGDDEEDIGFAGDSRIGCEQKAQRQQLTHDKKCKGSFHGGDSRWLISGDGNASPV